MGYAYIHRYTKRTKINIGEKKMETVSKLNQEEISKYLKEGKSIEQKVFDKLSPEEISKYFKANMKRHDEDLYLYSLKSLPYGIKFPERCKRLYLSSLKSLPKDFKFPERCEHLNLFNLKSLPDGIKFPESC